MSTKKQSSTKRILSEAKELSEAHGADGIVAGPLEDDMFTFHFTFSGPEGTPFENGLYHGKIMLPPAYPFAPPDMVLFTPNGRWETDKRICLSFTGYHAESWQPAWGVRTALLAVQALMGSEDSSGMGIGSIRSPDYERLRLARLSRQWTCAVCQKCNHDILAEATASTSSDAPDAEPAGETQAKHSATDPRSVSPLMPLPEPDPTPSRPAVVASERTRYLVDASTPVESPPPVPNEGAFLSQAESSTNPEPANPVQVTFDFTAPIAATQNLPVQADSLISQGQAPLSFTMTTSQSSQANHATRNTLPESPSVSVHASASTSRDAAVRAPPTGPTPTVVENGSRLGAPSGVPYDGLDRVPQLPSTVLRRRQREAPVTPTIEVSTSGRQTGSATASRHDLDTSFLRAQLLNQRRSRLVTQRNRVDAFIALFSFILAIVFLRWIVGPALNPVSTPESPRSTPAPNPRSNRWSLANDW